MKGKTLFITHAERDWRVLVNLWEAWKVLRDFRPHVIVSTGAGPVVPFALVGKLLFDVKVLFIETITRIESPSLTGKIMYYLADEFYYQWEGLRRHFPNGRFAGRLI
jgi:UDP-N-acetylglucosamine:LPS N-acetylglucosamine transferase